MPFIIKIVIFFWSYLIRSVQNGTKWIKLDQIGVLTNQKMLLQKVVTFTMTKKNTILFLIRLDQNCPNWIKLDQIVNLSNQQMLPCKVVTFIMRIQMVKMFWSDWIRFVQNGSKLDSSLVTLIIVFFINYIF